MFLYINNWILDNFKRNLLIVNDNINLLILFYKFIFF